jgi:small subunit ribosomal protein S5
MAKQKAAEGKTIKEALYAGEKEFEQRVLDLARVTRVTAGGKRMRFRCLVLVGDKGGRVGYGVEKAASVAAAVSKAVRHAKKDLFTVPLKNDTIPHEVYAKFGAAKILLKPAPLGTGVRAGGAARSVLELAGVPNVVGKSLGGKNKINNVKATFEALKKLRI